MLGKIAKKLRIFGFDTEYYSNIDDNVILKKSIKENRKVLTKDKVLYKRCIKLNIPCMLVESENELENLIFIVKEMDVKNICTVSNDFTRCTICNGRLSKTDRSQISLRTKEIPKRVLEKNELFFYCSNCQKPYWNGTHIQEINKLILEINKEIKK
jgi:uncharacterized protein with PIN domain